MKRCVMAAIVLAATAVSVSAQDSALKTTLNHVASLPMKHMSEQVIAPNTADAGGLTDEEYASLEQEFFKRMNWTQTEIDWFHNVYTPLYGDPRGYVTEQLEAMRVLEP